MPSHYDFLGPNAEAERERMRRDYGIRTDEQGRRSIQLPGQRVPNYISPAAFGESVPPDTTGIFRSRPQWNQKTGQWETPIDWGNILSLGTAAALTGGAANAFMAGAPAVLPSSSFTALTPLGGVGAASSAMPFAGLVGASIPAATKAMTSIGLPTAMGSGTGTSMGIRDIIGKLFGGGGNYGDAISKLLSAAGAGISGATSAAASNRGVQLEAAIAQEKLRQEQQANYEQQLINRSVDDRASGTDAFIKSVQANRVLNSTGYKPAMLEQRPGAGLSALPSFGTGMAAPTEQMRGDASALQNEIAKRLYDGSQLPALERPLPYTNDPELLRAGGGERIGNWLGPLLGGWGNFDRNNRNEKK